MTHAGGRPKGAKTGSGAHQPQPVKLYVERFDRGEASVWCVETGRGSGKRFHLAREVTVLVPMLTVFMGEHAPQPKAFLVGEAVLERRGDCLILQP